MDECPLDKAIQVARQTELVKSQVTDQSSTGKQLEEVSRRGAAAKKPGSKPGYRSQGRGQGYEGQRTVETQNKRQQQAQGATGTSGSCGKCGNAQHTTRDQTCRARGRRCLKCHKKGHFATVCYGKNVKEVTSADDIGDTFFLDSVDCDGEDDQAWHTVLHVCGKRVKFKIDTGADITVMSEATYRGLTLKPKLQPSKSTLYSPGGKIDCKGQFVAETTHKGTKYTFRVYVIGGTQTNDLLSRSAASKMKLIQQVEEINKGVFGNIGLLKCKPVVIKLKGNVDPYSMPTPRRVAFPLLPKVEEEIDRMLDREIIEKVTEPRDWCSPMVPVLKPTGKPQSK